MGFMPFFTISISYYDTRALILLHLVFQLTEWITSQLKEPIVPLKHLSFRWWVFRSVAIYKKKKSLIKMPFGTSIRLWTLLAERINVPICKEKRSDTFCIKPMLFLWWSRGELNPCPKNLPQGPLQFRSYHNLTNWYDKTKSN